jgi:hypothetical protein
MRPAGALRQHLLLLMRAAATQARGLPAGGAKPPSAVARPTPQPLLHQRHRLAGPLPPTLLASRRATAATTTTTTTRAKSPAPSRRTAASSAAAPDPEQELPPLEEQTMEPTPRRPASRNSSSTGRSRSAARGSSSSAADASRPRPPTPEVRQWMEASLAALRTPAAVRMRPFVDPAGDELALLPFPQQRSRQVLLEALVRRFRRDHPCRLLLVRCGDFYEAVGFDAVMLVEHLALNPMGDTSAHRAPRAGFPKANLRPMLRRLTDEAGLSVAVYEETRAFDSAGRKARVLGGVVSPAQPEYVWGGVGATTAGAGAGAAGGGERGERSSGGGSAASEALASARARPLLGASLTSRGCTLFRLDLVGVAASASSSSSSSSSPAVQPVLTVQENLTEESLWAAINEASLAPPFLLHTGGGGGGGGGGAAGGGTSTSSNSLGPGATTSASSGATLSLASAQRWQRRVAEVLLDRQHGGGGGSGGGGVSAASGGPSAAGLVRRYDHADALLGFELHARRALGLSPDEPIAVRRGGGGAAAGGAAAAAALVEPLPPFMSTARQLGLAPAAAEGGVPSLLDAALPGSAPRPCRDFVRRLLLRPPPPRVADGVRAALIALLRDDAPPLPDFRGAGGTVSSSSSSSSTSSLLSFSASVSPTKLMTLLRAREAGADALRSLSAMLGRVSAALDAPQLTELVRGLLPVVAREVGVDDGGADGESGLTAAFLARGCVSAVSSVARVVPGVPDADNDPDRAAAQSWEAARGETCAAVEAAFRRVAEGGGKKGGGARVAAAAAAAAASAARAPSSSESALSSSALSSWAAAATDEDGGDDEGASSSGLLPPLPTARATALSDGLLAMALAREAPILSRVRLELVREEMEAVAEARLAVARALAEGAAEAAAEAEAEEGGGGVALASEYDDLNASVWLAVVVEPRGVGSRPDSSTSSSRRKAASPSASSSPAPPPSTAALSAAVKRLSSRRADLFRAPIDRNGRGVRARHHFTTDALDAALVRYRRALDAAELAADARLRECAAELEREGLALVAACHFSVAALALAHHAAHAGVGRGWAVPEPLLLQEAGGGGGNSPPPPPRAASLLRPDAPIRLRGLWPFWMEKPGPGRRTVANDVDLDGVMALTGPNMAGKSTVLRSVAAACLLANCGLLAPCGAGGGGSSGGARGCCDVPPLQLFALRSFSGDAPAEGKSAFAVECEDTAYTLSALLQQGEETTAAAAPTTRGSLVLIDELGKGTEVRKGTALAAAVLERLASSPGCKGVFATHLHALRTLVPEGTGGSEAGAGAAGGSGGGVSHWHMQVAEAAEEEGEAEEEEDGHQRRRRLGAPTWRLRPGWCDESLAFEVAEASGVPQGVVARAAALLPAVDGALARRAAAAATAGGAVAAAALPPPPPPPPLPSWPSSDEVAGAHEEHDDGESVATAAAAPEEDAAAPSPLAALTTIDDGAALLLAAARDVLGGGSDGLATPSAASPSPLSVVVVRRGMSPPPAHAGACPCVYVVRWQDGWFYAGETERLATRLREHRARRGGAALEAAYVPVGAWSADGGGEGRGRGGGGKAAARALEALAIRRMAEEGLPLWSDRDGR